MIFSDMKRLYKVGQVFSSVSLKSFSQQHVRELGCITYVPHTLLFS